MDHARSLWAGAGTGAGTVEADREQELAQARAAEAERAAVQRRADRRMRTIRGLAVGIVWLGAGLTLMFLPMIAMSAGSECGVDDTRFICTDGGQDTIVYVAVYTSLVAALAGTWGAFSQRLLGRVVWGASLAALGVAWLINLLVIG
ncbi:hypothetical protein [Streptomyces sp. ME19-01-6]|uniref:hypothetical protein n=1 Tax=Streptomyces sp. ME19-01-6 TaxID=3028686 RepID=UPI0029B2FC82|nr:hypothetical protein [Streptomyces sp. ME19-01-6]MDX3226070.1 hypothetical protein [Streptomyces sp. ME19-01-6]